MCIALEISRSKVRSPISGPSWVHHDLWPRQLNLKATSKLAIAQRLEVVRSPSSQLSDWEVGGEGGGGLPFDRDVKAGCLVVPVVVLCVVILLVTARSPSQIRFFLSSNASIPPISNSHSSYGDLIPCLRQASRQNCCRDGIHRWVGIAWEFVGYVFNSSNINFWNTNSE